MVKTIKHPDVIQGVIARVVMVLDTESFRVKIIEWPHDSSSICAGDKIVVPMWHFEPYCVDHKYKTVFPSDPIYEAHICKHCGEKKRD